MQKHNDAIKTSGRSSLEKYTFHFIERVLCERELKTEQRFQHIDPPTLLTITALLSRSPGLLNRGSGDPALNRELVLTTRTGTLTSSSELQLIWTSCNRGYIIVFADSIQPDDSQGHPLISWYLRPDAPVIYTGAFLLLTAWLGQRSICNTWIFIFSHGKIWRNNIICEKTLEFCLVGAQRNLRQYQRIVCI